MNALTSLLGLLLTLGPATPGQQSPTDHLPAARSPLVTRTPGAGWPLVPRPAVVNGFDPPTVRWGAGHRGVDLLGDPGAAVRAPLAGTITFAGTIAGRGVVVIDHGGRRTTYEPVDPGVRRGSTVEAGAALGTLQAAPSHCLPRTCLHWGLIVGDDYADPLTLLGPSPVRLLPLGGAVRPVDEPTGTRSAAARW